MQNAKVVDPIPESFASIEEAAEFWDTHDTADYWDEMREVEVEYELPPRRRVSVATDIFDRLERIARERGISAETLVNLWLMEKVKSHTAPVPA